MNKVVLATRNSHKLLEIKAILQEINIQLLSINDFPGFPEIEETGRTFEENALLKARTVFKKTGMWALSDDSGLEVDALGGKPGVYSARYAGPGKDPKANNRKLLEELHGAPALERGAQFRCAAAVVGQGFEKIAEGLIRGKISTRQHGKGGFGYDPLFVPEGYQKTFAELGVEIKNTISHRYIAFKKAAQILAVVFDRR